MFEVGHGHSRLQYAADIPTTIVPRESVVEHSLASLTVSKSFIHELPGQMSPHSFRPRHVFTSLPFFEDQDFILPTLKTRH